MNIGLILLNVISVWSVSGIRNFGRFEVVRASRMVELEEDGLWEITDLDGNKWLCEDVQMWRKWKKRMMN